MMVSEKIIEAINEQIGSEFGAMIQYTSISAHFDAETLPELASFFARQAEEEREHALRFIKFVTDTGARVKIPALAAPQGHFQFAEEAIKLSLEQ